MTKMEKALLAIVVLVCLTSTVTIVMTVKLLEKPSCHRWRVIAPSAEQRGNRKPTDIRGWYLFDAKTGVLYARRIFNTPTPEEIEDAERKGEPYSKEYLERTNGESFWGELVDPPGWPCYPHDWPGSKWSPAPEKGTEGTEGQIP